MKDKGFRSTKMDQRGKKNPVGGDIYFAAVQTGPGAHPASYTMGTGTLSRAKAAVAWS
jgi:hypothetical protein